MDRFNEYIIIYIIYDFWSPISNQFSGWFRSNPKPTESKGSYSNGITLKLFVLFANNV